MKRKFEIAECLGDSPEYLKCTMTDARIARAETRDNELHQYTLTGRVVSVEHQRARLEDVL